MDTLTDTQMEIILQLWNEGEYDWGILAEKAGCDPDDPDFVAYTQGLDDWLNYGQYEW